MDTDILLEEQQINVASYTKTKNKFSTYAYRIVKRLVDIIAGVVGVLFLIPITFIAWILKTINKENGPVFYEQLRIGKNGKVFRMYKFRTMVIGADKKLEEYLASNEEARKEYKEFKKLKNDPRITKTGNFLRATSLDEWPQFIHLLSGSMTLVGPRPYLPKEQDDMGEYYDVITKVKPRTYRTMASSRQV